MIGNIGQFWRLTRELDVGALREAFEHPVTVRVLGSDITAAERVARLLEPDPSDPDVTVGVLGEPTRQRGDIVVAAIAGPLDADARRMLSDLSVGETPLLVVQINSGTDMLLLGVPDERVVALDTVTTDDVAREQLLGAVVRLAPEIALPLGRRHPLIREAVADHLIHDASRVNGQFAALASLPANIPLLGGVVGDMADILVLTKNQVLLVMKLGALYGRDLEFSRELMVEIAPVVGSAFLWRTTARALVGLLPSMLGLLPKTAVAYSGTYLVGEMARYYFHHGDKPPPEMVRELRNEGARLARQALLRLKRD